MLRANIPHHARMRHTYVTGGSGSGKSELLKVLVYDLLRSKRQQHAAFVVIDPHGDFGSEIASWQEFHGRHRQKLIYLDPCLSAEHGFVMNPLQISDRSPQNINRTARGLVAVFMELMDNATLSNQMEALLVPCLTVLLERSGSTLLCLRRFMDDAQNDDLVAAGLRSHDPTVREFFASGFQNRTYQNTKAAIYSRLQRLLNSLAFRTLTCGKSTVNLTAEVDRGAFIVFNLSKGALGADASQAFGRFVIATLQAHILRRASLPPEKRKPVHLVIDEFQNFICPSVEEILTESRKYKLYLTASQQLLGQKMSADFARTILSNTHIKITGANEHKTRTSIARETAIDADNFRDLRCGEFYVRAGNDEPFLLRVPRFLLGDKNSMKPAEWETMKAAQISKHYRPLQGNTSPKQDISIDFIDAEEVSAQGARQMIRHGRAIEPAPHLSPHPALA